MIVMMVGHTGRFGWHRYLIPSYHVMRASEFEARFGGLPRIERPKR